MNRLILCLVAICFFGSCKRDWRNVVIEKRLYSSGYYLHVPDKKYTQPKDDHPPVQYPIVKKNQDVIQPIYTVVTNDSVPVYYPRPYYPPTNVPVYTYTYVSVYKTTIHPSPLYGNGSSIVVIHKNDSVPPHTASWKIVKYDTAVDQPPHAYDTLTHVHNDTLTHLAQNDTLLLDTMEMVTVYGKQKHRRHIDGESSGFLQLGLINGPQSDGYPVNFYSFSFATGMRYKTKVNKWDAIVLDLGYRLNQFYIGQNDAKVFPLNAQPHDRERISMNNFSASISNRITFNRGEEKPPYWLDLGMYGDVSFRTSNVYVDKVLDSNSLIADKSKVTTKNVHLNFLSKWNYGANIRFGFNRYSCFAMWRLSDLIKHSDSENHSDLPRLIIGVEVNFGDAYDY